MIDEELLKILACPVCKKDVFLKNDWLVCRNCKKRYPIKNGIPIMLIEESQDYEEEK
ncbi:MAG: Trm112 family protein [Candidatus Omnitrophica bacterium]|nr:Trm112 family protein [Candidatus Omnitrophota bacterium]